MSMEPTNPVAKEAETVPTWSKNIALSLRQKSEYFEILGVFTHKELLEYIVNQLDTCSTAEATLIINHAKHLADVTLQKRISPESVLKSQLDDHNMD